MNDDQKLLKEYIKVLLAEDYPSASSDGRLYKGFVNPFARLAKVLTGKTKELASRSITLIGVAGTALASAFNPAMEKYYDIIFKADKERLKKIEDEYAEVYKSVHDSLQQTDLNFIAFMYNPGFYLTKGLVKNTPDAAANVIEVLSGGIIDKEKRKEIKNYLKKKFGFSDNESEDNGQKEKSNKQDELRKFFSSNDIQQLVNNSEASKKTREAVKTTIGNILKQVTMILSAKTLNDLKKIVGKDGIDPGMKKLANIPQKDRAASEDIILKQLKSNAKKFYSSKVKDMIKGHVESGADANSPLVEDYKNLLEKIKSM